MILADEAVIYRLWDGLLLCQSLGSTGEIRCNLLSLSSGVSTFMLVGAHLLSLSSRVSAAILLIHGYFSAGCSLASPSSAVSAVSIYLHVVAE